MSRETADWRCRLLGHRYRFSAEGAIMRWRCARGCAAGGEKRYTSSVEAARYAAAFDADGRRDLGRRAPLGLFPLRLARWWRRRRVTHRPEERPHAPETNC